MTAGAFSQNHSHWKLPPLAARKVDIAFIGNPFFGMHLLNPQWGLLCPPRPDCPSSNLAKGAPENSLPQRRRCLRAPGDVALPAGEANKGLRPETRLLYQHKEQLMTNLQMLKLRLKQYNVLISRQPFADYSQYIAQLQDIKARLCLLWVKCTEGMPCLLA